ncbi:MAG: hypothetical protein EOO04_08970 [Chitinophagaceae bacterium]|nr:MAG: hypothetical protein EOO04_08970 [Chitinophagaceae bacterium]
MKHRILTLALLLSISITSTFANISNDAVKNYKAANAFKREFTQAQDVKWEETKEFSKATFKLNDQVMIAYYSTTGELLGVTRNITASQLPLNLLNDVKKNYANSWITDLFEITTNAETSYYVTLEDADQTLVLKSSGAYGWSTYKKEKKNIQ